MLHYMGDDADILEFHNDDKWGKITTVAITTNTVKVMGKGLALQFKKKYPEHFETYKKKLTHFERIGLDTMQPFLVGRHNEFMMFPTKRHWRNKSNINDIRTCLEHVRHRMGGLFYNLALPKLGCANGGLDWACVEDVIIDVLGDVHYEVFIFGESKYHHKDDPELSDEQNMVNWLFS